MQKKVKFGVKLSFKPVIGYDNFVTLLIHIKIINPALLKIITCFSIISAYMKHNLLSSSWDQGKIHVIKSRKFIIIH